MANNSRNNESKLSFSGQRDDETLLFVFRRHIIAMRKGFYVLAIIVAITSLPMLIWGYSVELFVLAIAGLIIGLLIFCYHLILWYFTIYIVTNQRIRQTAQRSFFNKDVVDLSLSKIQNISYNIPGFNGDIFKFGTITIQTSVGDLVIHNVEQPEKTYNKLQDAVSNIIETRVEHEEADK